MITLTLRGEGSPVLRQFSDETIMIGRSATNHLVIRDPRVSRLHARIEGGRNGAQLIDLKSGNGTRLNGKKIDTIPLRVGDTLEIGPTRWSVLDLEAAETPPEVVAASPAETGTADPSGFGRRGRRSFRRTRPRFSAVRSVKSPRLRIPPPTRRPEAAGLGGSGSDG